MTSGALARELEVTQRTILRDVDALTQAGLPMVVLAGYRGGIELGFGHRTRLAALAADDAEAIGDTAQVMALVDAVREHRTVRIQTGTPGERVVHPTRLVFGPTGWLVEDALSPDAPIALHDCGDINISAKRFVPPGRR